MKSSRSPPPYTKIVGLLALTFVSVIITVMFFRKTEKFESKPTLTYYYLPGCGWCKKFTPVWDEYVSSAPSDIVLRKINAEEASEEVDKYAIKGFPHIQLVKGDKVTAFDSERTKEALAKFVQDNL